MGHCSKEQYKKQFRRWKWGRNIKAKEVGWMAKTAEKRRVKDKDTLFVLRHQHLTEEDIRDRLTRMGEELGKSIMAGGTMSLP